MCGQDHHWRKVHSVLVGIFAVVMAIPTFAQTFPVKPISIYVGFVPGGGNDFVARVIANEMATELKQPVLVENRPGSAGELAAAMVARSRPDGYTILLGSNGALTISPTLRDNLPYDPATQLEPIGMLTKSPLLLSVGANSKLNSLNEVIAFARENPGKLTYASSGTGTNLHLTGALFQALSETEILHIPYKGGSQAIQDVASGQVDMIFSVISVVQPLVKAGKLKVLGITSEASSPIFPDVEPISDSLPDFSSLSWNGFFVSSDTPENIKKVLYDAMTKALTSQKTVAQFSEQGLEPFRMDAEQTKKYLASETDKWAKIIREEHIASKNEPR